MLFGFQKRIRKIHEIAPYDIMQTNDICCFPKEQKTRKKTILVIELGQTIYDGCFNSFAKYICLIRSLRKIETSKQQKELT